MVICTKTFSSRSHQNLQHRLATIEPESSVDRDRDGDGSVAQIPHNQTVTASTNPTAAYQNHTGCTKVRDSMLVQYFDI